MGRLWRDYSLSITAAVLFAVTWLVYAVVEWFDFKHEMSWYGEPVAFGSYLTRFFAFSPAGLTHAYRAQYVPSCCSRRGELPR